MKIVVLLSIVSSLSAQAAGYTFLSTVSHALHIPEYTLTFAFVLILLALIGLIYRAKSNSLEKAIVPDYGISFRNIIESIGQFVYNVCLQILGEDRTKIYYKTIVFLFITILFSNLIGSIPGFLPPTTNVNVTIALGIFSIIYVNILGIKAHGLIGHLKHFAGPVWYLSFLILPLELISELVKPLSLALRLRGNMSGDHQVLTIFSGLQEWLVPIPFYALGILVSCIQAFVFTTLTIIYISLVTEHHDHGEGAEHH